MSIQRIQTQRVLEDVARYFYATGNVPLLSDILGLVANYFSAYPAGNPLPLPDNFLVTDNASDVDAFNQVLARTVQNLDVLYENSLDQLDELMDLNQALINRVKVIDKRRAALASRVQDFLLTAQNTDGYFLAVSDTFSDLTKTDLTLTNAFVDTTNHEVSLPPLMSQTTTLDRSLIGTPSVAVTVNGSSFSYFRDVSTWSGALNGLNNSVWEIQVPVNAISEVVVTLAFPLGTPLEPAQISQVLFEPYGISPVQVWMASALTDTPNSTAFKSFGNEILTSTDRMVFNDVSTTCTSWQINLRKTAHDYIDQSSGITQYVYVFGAKEISFLAAVFDSFATFVSAPLAIPQEVSSEMVVDALSVEAGLDLPSNTEIDFFIAADTGSTSLSGFNWQGISPLGSTNTAIPQIVQMNGARSINRMIVSDPGSEDLQLLPLDSTNNDLSKRNPSALIIPGLDVYTLCNFTDQVSYRSSLLEEGVNSTRILSIPLDPTSTADISFWTDYVSGAKPSTLSFGRIDTGNGFLYGGDIGESGVSVYAETYLNTLDQIPPFLAPCTKADANSQLWDIRVYLNGRNLGYMPVGTNTAMLPWAFQAGLNHIAVLANIPAATAATITPYMGSINLLTNQNLYSFGDVRLASWNYVSLFDLQYNTLAGAPNYTFYNNQIITRRQPTTNFRIQYASPTGQGPQAVRLRADLSRNLNLPSLSPKLKSYRIRFSYG